MRKLSLFIVSLFLVSGCGDDGNSDPNDECKCVAGQSKNCQCPGGVIGTTWCKDDCSGWTPCECGDPVEDVYESTDEGRDCPTGYIWDDSRGSCVKESEPDVSEPKDVSENCSPSHSVKKCRPGENAIYWQDACGAWNDLYESCGTDEYCDDASTSCEKTPACGKDSDCPVSTCGTTAWSNCSGFSNECDETGTMTKVCVNYRCDDGECVEVPQNLQDDCTRDTEDDTCKSDGWCEGGNCIHGCKDNSDCAPRECDDWSTCTGYSNTCDETGTQERTCYSESCNTSTHECKYTPRTESQACTGRDTDGTSCDSTDYSSWGNCDGFSNLCDESGTQSRTKTTYACSSGSCKSSSSTESQVCNRDTDGTSCDTTDYSSWGACDYSNLCDESAKQTRTKTTYACSSGSCKSSSSTESQTCSRNTDGTSCDDSDYFSWGICTGFSTECDESGKETRSVTTYKCSNSACKSSSSTESRNCTRDTDGDNCGNNDECDNGSCVVCNDPFEVNDGKDDAYRPGGSSKVFSDSDSASNFGIAVDPDNLPEACISSSGDEDWYKFVVSDNVGSVLNPTINFEHFSWESAGVSFDFVYICNSGSTPTEDGYGLTLYASNCHECSPVSCPGSIPDGILAAAWIHCNDQYADSLVGKTLQFEPNCPLTTNDGGTLYIIVRSAWGDTYRYGFSGHF